MLHRVWIHAVLCFWLAATSHLSANELYESKIKPLFEAKCVSCHGAIRQEAGLRLDAGQLIHQGSGEGPILDFTKPTSSRLWERVANATSAERMPPPDEGVPLNASELLVLQQWMEQGAKYPSTETFLADPLQHWAYRSIPRSEADIDSLIEKQQRAQQLQPLSIASPEYRIRRIYFDLIGLPPSADAVIAFQQACATGDADRAYQEIVDQLLSSPQYGERWARHWMDIWRYSDWDGYKNDLRGSQRHIWHWRDWIVGSLNQNKPYDQMVREMLAADELYPLDRDALRATGFLARNYHVSNRNIWMDAAVEHTAKAFLGLTINCAKCHDHKYDPIAQEQYYQFRAIFEPYHVRAELLPGILDEKVDGIPRAYDANPTAETFVYTRGDEKQPQKDRKISPAPPAFLSPQWQIKPVLLPLFSYYPGLQPHVIEEQIREAQKQVDGIRDESKGTSVKGSRTPEEQNLLTLKLAAAESKLQSLRQRLLAELAKYQSENSRSPSELELLNHAAALEHRRFERYDTEAKLREAEFAVARLKEAAETNKGDAKKQAAAMADAGKKLEAARKAYDSVLAATDKQEPDYPPLGKVYARESTGRRTALAHWITSKENPLAPRVAVNHVWARHFGEPLVPNMFDFGLKTPAPPLVELLDSLASGFVESGWDLKQLHRRIVLSAAYQRQSQHDTYAASANRKRDPDNAYLWHFPQQRLDAEIIRDALLSVGGSLDPTMGGPDLDFQKGDQVYRRSLYFRHAYEKQMTLLVTFDAASPLECYRRSPSIIPQQALAMTNGNLARSMARRSAQRIWDQLPMDERSTTSFVRMLYLHTLNRLPEVAEIEACERFLLKQKTTYASGPAKSLTKFSGGSSPLVAAAEDADARARESLTHVLLNHNDFITLR